jgi:AcrR family transcriptional regulator
MMQGLLRRGNEFTKTLSYPNSPVNSKPNAMKPGETAAQPSLRLAAMRKPKQPQANRARIVKAAIEEFAARGFKGASMDAIAARTHTTRALINYYFGGKEKIYIAVLEQVYSEIRDAEAKLELDDLEPADAVRRIVEFTYGYYLTHEGFVRLVVAENQARGRHLRKSKGMRTLNRPIIDMLAGVIKRGQASGAFRRDVDPVEVHMAIAALGMFNVTNQYTFGAIFQRDMGRKGDVRRRRAMVAAIILRYLSAQGEA